LANCRFVIQRNEAQEERDAAREGPTTDPSAAEPIARGHPTDPGDLPAPADDSPVPAWLATVPFPRPWHVPNRLLLRARSGWFALRFLIAGWE
jgi:hypothetical protein